LTGTPSAPHTHLFSLVRQSKADLPALAYVEREDSLSGGEIFASTHVLARSVGHVINMVEFMPAAKDADKSGDRFEISNNNVINVTEEHLNDVRKQQLAQAVDGYKATCLRSFSFRGREGKVIQKGALPTPRHHEVPRPV